MHRLGYSVFFVSDEIAANYEVRIHSQIQVYSLSGEKPTLLFEQENDAEFDLEECLDRLMRSSR